MRNIYYRFGFGAFTNQDELYFVDFANFARHNLPVGWNDEIGGVFQVLDGRWYNSSRRYVRGHFTYEAFPHSPAFDEIYPLCAERTSLYQCALYAAPSALP